jgi:3',5'-cyclic-AMP phosphodiesterase
MIICQISDMHIKPEGRLAYGVVDTAAKLADCVARIGRLVPAPDLVLATGDLVDGGSAVEYERLKTLLAPLAMPVYLMPGNHDERGALRMVFREHAYLEAGPFIQYAVDTGPLRVLALDTVVPRTDHGALCETRLAWLDAALSADARPTLIAMHHPPFATGIAFMDACGLLEGAAAFEAIVRRHPHAERIVCGHLHRTIETRFAGTVAGTCPSTAHQLLLNLNGIGGDGFMLEPPGFQLHAWHGGRLVTHTVPIGNFAGPYPFNT